MWMCPSCPSGVCPGWDMVDVKGANFVSSRPYSNSCTPQYIWRLILLGLGSEFLSDLSLQGRKLGTEAGCKSVGPVIS